MPFPEPIPGGGERRICRHLQENREAGNPRSSISLQGCFKPTSGCVLAGGKDLYRMADGELSKFRNENIAVIPQGGGAIYSLTAEENIRLGPEYLWKERRARHPADHEKIGDRTAERRVSLRTFRRRAAPRGHCRGALPGHGDPSCR